MLCTMPKSRRTACIWFCHTLLNVIRTLFICSFANSACVLSLSRYSPTDSGTFIPGGLDLLSLACWQRPLDSLALQHPRGATSRQHDLSPTARKCFSPFYTASTSHDTERAAPATTSTAKRQGSHKETVFTPPRICARRCQAQCNTRRVASLLDPRPLDQL